MSKELIDLKKNFEKIYFNENLSRYSWFNLGGTVDVFFKPKNEDNLINFLKHTNKSNKKINIIGAGSNTLIREGKINGVMIKLGSNFSYIRLLSDHIIEVGAATLDRKISDFATENSLTGLEFLSCIPGSIGGGIIMNSGCYGYEISKILESLKTIDHQGNIKEINQNEIKFSYRGSNLPKNLIILSAKLRGDLLKKDVIKNKQFELIKKKKDSQPSQIKTCGSTFKNPKNIKAWQLIKESSCDKLFVGDAKISEKHCNFFVNNGKATTIEIESLINEVKKKVLKKTGIELELEIKIVGENK